MCRYDHYLHHSIVLCFFQVYRICLVPCANTWMLWSLFRKLNISVSNATWVAQALVLASCMLIQKQPLLHDSLQFVTLCFSASTATRICPSSASKPMSLVCLGGVMMFQAAVGLLARLAAIDYAESTRSRDFLPHVQPRRPMTRT